MHRLFRQMELQCRACDQDNSSLSALREKGASVGLQGRRRALPKESGAGQSDAPILTRYVTSIGNAHSPENDARPIASVHHPSYNLRAGRYDTPLVVRVTGRRGAIVRVAMERSSCCLITIPFGCEATAVEEVRPVPRIACHLTETTDYRGVSTGVPFDGGERRRRRQQRGWHGPHTPVGAS